MRTIVIGFDDHEKSRRALERAATLARPLGATVVVVAVAEMTLTPELPATDEFLDAVPVAMELDVPDEIETAFAHAREVLDGHGVEADYVWAVGDPGALLLEVARDRDGEVVVIGEHHASLFGRLLGSSVADEVLKGAGCDVLIVR